MKISKKLSAFLAESKSTDSFWAEDAKLEFSVALENQRRRAGLSYADIAKAIDSSPAYITKVFRGDANLTIESMVKLTRAISGQLDIRVLDTRANTQGWNISQFKRPKLRLVTATVTTQNSANGAANHIPFELPREVAA